MTRTEIKREIERLDSILGICSDKRVRDLINSIRAENKPRIDELKKMLEDTGKRTPPRRWPEDVPAEILEYCSNFWSGTDQHRSFRIHCWNDKAVWTSYPAGGYSDNTGWHPTTSGYFLIKRGDSSPSYTKWHLVLEEKSGRISPSYMMGRLSKI